MQKIAYLIVVIITSGITFFSLNYLSNDSSINLSSPIATSTEEFENNSAPETPEKKGSASEKTGNEYVLEKNKKFLCGGTFEKSSNFINEFSIPLPCSQPLGIAADNNNSIWIAATWSGYLLVFDPNSNTFTEFIKIPGWTTSDSFGPMIWDLKFDKKGDLWFTDQSNFIWRYFTKEDKFEKYRVPTRSSYPSSIVIDSQNMVWFSEIFGEKLGMLIPSETENNTTKGIKEFDLGKEVEFETMGPLSIGYNNTDNTMSNNGSEVLWMSAVDYPQGGFIVNFDIATEKFTTYDLGSSGSVPVGVVEDEQGMVWVNDHDSNLFFRLDPQSGNVKKYSTSPASTRNTTTTLPYYNEYNEGKVWFNEHEGNAIAYYDKENNTLVEYHIPTRGPIWGNTSNPLRFTIDNNGSIWFTEWTESKIGVLQNEKMNNLPIGFSLSKDSLTIDSDSGKGDSVDIYLYRNNESGYQFADETAGEPIDMLVASSISKWGLLQNLTGQFSNDQFFVTDLQESNEEPYKITLNVSPTESNVIPGNYTLTISARYNDVTYSKIVDLNII